MISSTEPQEQFATSGPDLEELAKNLRKSIRGNVAFGEPIRHGKTTIVPVARASWGVGGGSGFAGRGGGGGMSVRPAGFIVMDQDGVRYCPIHSASSRMLLLLGGFAALMLLALRSTPRPG